MLRSLTVLSLLLISVPALAQPAPPELPEFLQAELDVPYAATDSLRQRLDIYLPKQPATTDPLPVVVIIHGLFQNPNKRSSLNLATEFVQSGGLLKSRGRCLGGDGSSNNDKVVIRSDPNSGAASKARIEVLCNQYSR